MPRTKGLRLVAGLFVALSLATAAACSDDDDDATTDTTEQQAEDSGMASGSGDEAMADSAEACDAEAITEAVQSGEDEGTLEGMTDDPVATAASNNPVLTQLAGAVDAAGLVDTLNSAPALTVFAPTDCAFAAVDPATLNAAMADPTGLLAQVLGFHVVPEQLAAADLTTGELPTVNGAPLPITVDGDTVSVGGDQAEVVVPDIQTANATVHLIDAVMLPPMDEVATATTMG